jgi:hypothetical protein
LLHCSSVPAGDLEERFPIVLIVITTFNLIVGEQATDKFHLHLVNIFVLH